MLPEPNWIRALDDDPERIEALAYLAEVAQRYPPRLFTPPLERPKNPPKQREHGALHFHVARHPSTGEYVCETIEYSDDDGDVRDFPPTAEDAVSFLVTHVLHHRNGSKLIACTSNALDILDVFLQAFGPLLLARGYTLEPCLGQGGITWMTIRRGKRKFELSTVKAITGESVHTLLAFARDAGRLPDGLWQETQSIHLALGAYRCLLSDHFGSALRPTIGMIASLSARVSLPSDVLKWRPSPLLVAMERVGMGYRGGLAYGQKFRGSIHRIDVNRQYTAMLARPLPMETTFRKWKGASDGCDGVYVCSVQFDRFLPYPLGVYNPVERRFTYVQPERGEYVCVLHTSEFDGLYAHQARIIPGYGFAFTRVFDLGDYVESLTQVTSALGRSSAGGRLVKHLGNMVYGKFGQRPDRWQLLFSEKAPDKTWYPYFNDAGEDIPFVWERESVRYTSGMHVDIAATITGYARAQTMQMWAYLEAYGYTVVRAHTDSITVNRDPRDVLNCDDELIGAWKYEGYAEDGAIIGPNAFVDQRGAHIAGVSAPTVAMIDEMYDDGSVEVTQQQKAPRQGWQRGVASVTKRLTG